MEAWREARGNIDVGMRIYFQLLGIPSLYPSVFIVPSSQDASIVVESFKSGFDPPGDFPFEDFSQNLSRTGSDGTISGTPKGEREREGAPGPRPDPKHMSRTKNKLWLFGKKPKVYTLGVMSQVLKVHVLNGRL